LLHEPVPKVNLRYRYYFSKEITMITKLDISTLRTKMLRKFPREDVVDEAISHALEYVFTSFNPAFGTLETTLLYKATYQKCLDIVRANKTGFRNMLSLDKTHVDRMALGVVTDATMTLEEVVGDPMAFLDENHREFHQLPDSLLVLELVDRIKRNLAARKTGACGSERNYLQYAERVLACLVELLETGVIDSLISTDGKLGYGDRTYLEKIVAEKVSLSPKTVHSAMTFMRQSAEAAVSFRPHCND